MDTELKQLISFGAAPSIDDVKKVTQDMVSLTSIPPEKFEIPLNFPTVNELCAQKQLGICTMCAVRMAAEETFRDGERLSEYWGYLMGKVFEDGALWEGSSAYSMLRNAYRKGIPSKKMEALYPLRTNGTYQQFINHFNTVYGGVIPQAVIDDAARHKILGFYSVTVDPYSIAKAISSGHVIVNRFVVGDNTYKDINQNVTWDANKLLPLRAPLYIDGGHLMAQNKYDGINPRQKGAGPNSWGTRWCENNTEDGAGYYNYHMDTQQGCFTESWAITPVPITEIFKHEFKKKMKYKDQNEEVRALQMALKIDGTFPQEVSATAYYGLITAKAVYDFQTKHKVDKQSELDKLQGKFSVVGPKTLAKLNELFNQ